MTGNFPAGYGQEIKKMKITVLTDNNSCGALGSEWGLSFWIEFDGHRILLDTGATSLFYENAQKLGIPIETADCAVLSHAHYDHCGGLSAFFEANHTAPAYLRAGAGENCWHWKDGAYGYIGIPYGVLDRYRERIIPVEGVLELFPNVLIVPHTPATVRQSANPSLLILEDGNYQPDTFDHEQSLVIDSGDGLVILSSCSHTGPANITADVKRALPGRPLKAYIGGLHIYRWTADQVRELSDEIKAAGIEKVYTGHCTGGAFSYLKENLGNSAVQFYAGMVIS